VRKRGEERSEKQREREREREREMDVGSAPERQTAFVLSSTEGTCLAIVI